MKPGELHELLVKMREIQAERGQAKGISMDDKGRVCYQGAFALARGVSPHKDSERFSLMLRALGFPDYVVMYRWNDNHTLAEVLERLDAAIEATTPSAV